MTTDVLELSLNWAINGILLATVLFMSRPRLGRRKRKLQNDTYEIEGKGNKGNAVGTDNIVNSIHLSGDTSKEMLYFSLYKETQQALNKALEQQAFDRRQLELAQGRVARLKVKLQERESHIAELKAGQSKVPMLPFAVSLEPSSSRKHF